MRKKHPVSSLLQEIIGHLPALMIYCSHSCSVSYYVICEAYSTIIKILCMLPYYLGLAFLVDFFYFNVVFILVSFLITFNGFISLP